MLVLAVDTAASSMGAALWCDGSLLGETVLQIGLTHSETLMPVVDDLFRQCRRQKTEVDLLACTKGPGSYTGIRIGVSTVMGMAYALGKPALAFSTLAILAQPYAFLHEWIICPMLDARNQRVFAGAWHAGQIVVREDNWQADLFLDEADKAAHKNRTKQLLVMGSGGAVLRRNELMNTVPGIMIMPDYTAQPRPAIVAAMAEQKYQLQHGISTEQTWIDLMPEYLSLTQAERRRLAESG